MKYLEFTWNGDTSLARELRRPLQKVSMGFSHSAWGPDTLTLWRDDSSGIKVFSQMHDIAERDEIGVLCFELVTAADSDEVTFDVSGGFNCELQAFKLILNREGTRAECGLAIRGSMRDEIVIIPNAGPCHLAVAGLPSSNPHIFEPEYDLDSYIRAPFS